MILHFANIFIYIFYRSKKKKKKRKEKEKEEEEKSERNKEINLGFTSNDTRQDATIPFLNCFKVG